MKLQFTALLLTSLLTIPAFAASQEEKTFCGTVETSAGPTLMGSHGPMSQVKHSFKVPGIKGAFAFTVDFGSNHEDDFKRWPSDEAEMNKRIERNKIEARRHNNARDLETQIIVKASHVKEICIEGVFGMEDDGSALWVAPKELKVDPQSAALEADSAEDNSPAL